MPDGTGARLDGPTIGAMGRVRALGALLIAVAVVGVGGAVVGASTLTATQVGSIPAPDIEIYMTVKATPEQIAAVRKVVRRSGSVRTFAFLNHEDALREFRRLYRDQPDVLAKGTAETLPTSFRVVLAEGEKPGPLKRALNGVAGVDEIKDLRGGDAMSKQIRRRCGWWAKNPDAGDIEVFLKVGATAPEAEAVRAMVEQSPSVQSVHLVSEAEAVKIFRRLFAKRPKVRDSVIEGQLPMSLRVKLRPGAATASLALAWQDLAGVDDVRLHPYRAECEALARLST
jgi:cell division protein FtsX